MDTPASTICTASSGSSPTGNSEHNSSAPGGIQDFASSLEPFMVDPGINRNVFKSLAASLKSLDKDYRICSLMFDEMSIREHVDYDPVRDLIIGFEDLGSPRDRKNAIARQALVFMARGLLRDWKQPLSFYFTRDGVSADMLAVLLREVLEECESAGLSVVSAVCDTAASNLEALKIMGVTERRPYFLFKEKKVVALFDVPHLLTCTRDHLYKDVVHVPMEIDGVKSLFPAEWQQIRETVKWDENLMHRFLDCVTERHLDPVGPDATKVSLASQVLSYKMASCVDTCVKLCKILPMSALGAAKVCAEMGKLFDSLSGVKSQPDGVDGIKRAISTCDEVSHLHFWSTAIYFLEEWKYSRRKVVGETVIFEQFVPASHIGWLQTLRGVILLWEILKISKVSLLRLGWLSLDSLENLFELFRHKCRLNRDPTAAKFISVLETSLLNGVVDCGAKHDGCKVNPVLSLSGKQCDSRLCMCMRQVMGGGKMCREIFLQRRVDKITQKKGNMGLKQSCLPCSLLTWSTKIPIIFGLVEYMMVHRLSET
ncbi:hypothetical protein J437_LFUL005429 [Ladona fulva]|uniref:Transposable element P transposase-like RNase H domain-containing protein n=1 Tax=Ladona fulva TaxID=123851 RepID=A0A8K0NTA2_LADFU|nr:hypothetical protein J437_LFUL005429 [Ladona fulva]